MHEHYCRIMGIPRLALLARDDTGAAFLPIRLIELPTRLPHVCCGDHPKIQIAQRGVIHARGEDHQARSWGFLQPPFGLLRNDTMAQKASPRLSRVPSEGSPLPIPQIMGRRGGDGI